ncbi:MAG TPA: hypothetical protein PKD24_12695 [Pyrinomonadaceae bacterium]|nr:hypothetical protein [Pyrinomonadaceae bacterium]HMP66468.1 hypothetical protein [Pyrinomonadaceae bacterium]
MKAEKYSVGDSISLMCSGCDDEQPHTIQTVTKLGKISKAICDTCEGVSTFNRGVKTSVSAGKGKAASPYDRTRKYRKGQAMTHDKFGHGEVTAVVEPQKIDVLFSDGTRRLIHAQE